MLKFNCNNSKIIIDNLYEIYNNMKVTRILKQRELENTEKVSKQYKEVSKLLNTIVDNIKEGALVKDDLQKNKTEKYIIEDFIDCIKFYDEN